MILYIVIAGKLRNNFHMSDTLRYTIPVIAFSLSPFSYRVEAPHYSCWCSARMVLMLRTDGADA